MIAHRDDYARDRHPAGIAYEAALGPAARRVKALLTSCGMSSFVVALEHLEREGGLRRSVLIGASTYHETRDLFVCAALGAVCSRSIPTTRSPQRSSAGDPPVSSSMPLPPSRRRRPRYRGRARRSPRPVRAPGWSSTSPERRSSLCRRGPRRMLAIESLTKHAQLGLDRVTAGAIYAPAAISRPSTAARASRSQHRRCVRSRPPQTRRAVLARRLGAMLAMRQRSRRRMAAAPRRGPTSHTRARDHPGHGRCPQRG